MYKELKDYFPDAVTGDGIFKAISNISWFPGVKPAAVDTYFILMNGEKLGSKILEAFANEDGVIEGDKLKALATMIHNKYITNWEHEYKTLTVEYNPIENTDYVETYKGSAQGTSGGTTTEGGKVKSTTNINGLGSSGLVSDSETTQDFAPDGESSARKTTVSGNSSGSDEHEIRKHGNIGVTTNAQMIMSDLETWKLNNFYDILCSDICDVIALSIF
jgi:hypothetical protein